jgi:oligoribonuclease (3'-5' exoribonuclease)
MDRIVEKKSNHRAMDDIRESIEELKKYRSVLLNPASEL